MKDCREAYTDLATGAREFGLKLDSRQHDMFISYCHAIQEATRHVNVTGIHDSQGIMTVLFLDSLTVEPSLRTHFGGCIPGGLRMIDVGSGAGIPGLPLKIAHPEWHMTLVESVGKKARFIEQTVRNLGLTLACVEARRSEDLARDVRHRDSYDVAVARAVAPLVTLIELCAPFVRPGGTLLFPKSGDLEQEIQKAVVAGRDLGVRGPFLDSVPAHLKGGKGQCVVRYEKVGKTSHRFPRRTGLARSAPLVTPSVPRGAARPRAREGPSG